MNILITGGAGFIGSSLTEKLLRLEYLVTAVDNFNPYYPTQYKREYVQPFFQRSNYSLVEGDVIDEEFIEKIFKKKKFDTVIHLAASVGVRNSLRYPDQYRKNNITGTQNVLEAARKNNVRQFIFASSSSVYGNNSTIPFKEDKVTESKLNPYAQTKKHGEELCFEYHKKYGLPITIFRFFTVYGPKGRPDMSPYIFTKSILEEKQLVIFGDGKQKRDFTNITDIVRGIVLGLEHEFPFEIFNLGNSSPVELRNFISIIERIAKKKAYIRFNKENRYEMRDTYADIKKSGKLLGYKPKIGLEEGVEIFINWFKENRMQK